MYQIVVFGPYFHPKHLETKLQLQCLHTPRERLLLRLNFLKAASCGSYRQFLIPNAVCCLLKTFQQEMQELNSFPHPLPFIGLVIVIS